MIDWTVRTGTRRPRTQQSAGGLHGPLTVDCDDMIRVAGFPFGAHVCEVEIDPDTGKTDIVRYAAVDDVGRAINPLILHGQTHGGIVQGVGQALWEHAYYDPITGQLLAGSFQTTRCLGQGFCRPSPRN